MDVSKYLIPDYRPFFGGADFPEMVRPALPEDWEDAVEGFAFVSPQHDKATDSGNPLGSRGLPRKTLPESTPLIKEHPAGFVCVVKGHLPYQGNGQEQFVANGTPEAPVWLCGEDAFNRFSTGLNVFIMGQCLIIEHHEILEKGGSLSTRAHPNHKTARCHQICFRDMYGEGEGEFVSGSNTGFGVSGNTLYPDIDDYAHRRDIIVCRTTIKKFGSTDWTYGNGGEADNADFHAFAVGRSVSRFWFIENEGSECQGDGIQMGVAQLENNLYPAYLFIGGNTFHYNGENSADFKKCRKVIFSNNDCITRGGSIVSHDKAEDIFMLNNNIHESRVGIALTTCIRNYVIGNTIWDINVVNEDVRDQSDPDAGSTIWGSTSALFVKDASASFVLNNTFQNYLRGLEAHTSSLSLKMSNNVFMGRRTRPSQIDPLGEDIIAESGFRRDTVFRNNYFEDWRGRYLSVSRLSTDIVDLSANDSSNPGNTGNVSTPLLKVNTEFGNSFLTLMEGSPLIDSGISEDMAEAVANFAATFSDVFEAGKAVFDRDLFGYKRLTNSNYDIGANEYGTEFAPAPPYSPVGLYIDVVTEKLKWELASLNEDSITVSKNGVVIATLDKGTTELEIPDINNSKDIYNVSTINTYGVAVSVNLLSSVVSVVENATIMLDSNYGGHYLFRQSINKGNLGGVALPVFSGNEYAVKNPAVTYTDQGESYDGYVYTYNPITGEVISSSANTTVDLHIIFNSFSKEQAIAEFRVRDSIIRLVNDGGLKRYKVSIDVNADNAEYLYQITQTDGRAAIGIAAIGANVVATPQ